MRHAWTAQLAATLLIAVIVVPPWPGMPGLIGIDPTSTSFPTGAGGIVGSGQSEGAHRVSGFEAVLPGSAEVPGTCVPRMFAGFTEPMDIDPVEE